MTTWEGDYMKSVVHMMGNLAKDNRVLFIDYAFTIKDLIMGLAGLNKAPIRRMLGISPRVRSVTYKNNTLLHVTLPPTLPINCIKQPQVFDFLMNLQMGLIYHLFLKRILKKNGFNSATMINAFNPAMGHSLAKMIKPVRTIYYCYDEIAEARWCKKHGARLEVPVAKEADHVIVTSSALLEAKKHLNSNCHLIKNGVDFELFHTAYNQQPTKSRITIGYLGSIDDRLDYALLEKVIAEKQECDFLFVGRVTCNQGHKRLKKYINVTFAGAQSPQMLPKFLSTFDLAMIPFVKNEFTRNIYPLKINEYLAAGVPVISTPFADLSDFHGYITLADSPQAFIRDIVTYPVRSKGLIQARIKLARSNDWSFRSKQMAFAL
ncbi:MAG: glycosyltransferase involved in cell wall biosynthesis [Cyclobacteriaceae bacterium]|jgi:glycosyltransferase involved in cell wall biosynthesis